MVKQFSARCVSTLKVVLALVLPTLVFTGPVILVFKTFQPLEEWMVWLIIVVSLGSVISLSIWLALRMCPKTILGINKQEISFKFDQTNFFSPKDFTFNVADITSFARRETPTTRTLQGEEYFVIKTRNPKRRIQLSPTSYDINEFLRFNEAMVEIDELVNSSNG